MKYITSIILIGVLGLISCKVTSDNSPISPEEFTRIDITEGLIEIYEEIELPNLEKRVNIDSMIIICPEVYCEELAMDIEYYLELWKDVPSPFIATYRGNDIGDYFHLEFEDENDEVWDFGHGNNDFGKYPLYDNDKDLNDDPKYLNQKFEVYWKWRISEFPCCSGDYEIAKAYMPSIVNLKLIE